MRACIARIALLAVVALATVRGGVALDNGLARTPQMGWNSWNRFACNVNETIVRAAALALVESGLARAGYQYVNVDDCWQSSRDASGRIVADPQTFPSGMAALADYVHSLGLKFGLYSDAGQFTCQGRPGGLGHEKMDAQSYAEWGVDYLKYDNCYNEGIAPQKRYPPMRDALNATGRPIFYSLCEWGQDDPASWAAPVGNSWRTTADISDTWESMMSNIDANDASWASAAPGGFNDADMLEVGNGGMTLTEYTTHFSLWALAKSPLIIGCDLSSSGLTPSIYTILSNTEVIAVSQDSLGIQGHKTIPAPTGVEVWAGPLFPPGDYAMVVVNRGNASAAPMEVKWAAALPASSGPAGGDHDADADCFAVRDLWAHEDLGAFQTTFTTAPLQSHESQMVRITPCANAASMPDDRRRVRVATE